MTRHGLIEHPVVVDEGQDMASALNGEIRADGGDCPCGAYEECDPDDHCPLLEEKNR